MLYEEEYFDLTTTEEYNEYEELMEIGSLLDKRSVPEYIKPHPRTKHRNKFYTYEFIYKINSTRNPKFKIVSTNDSK